MRHRRLRYKLFQETDRKLRTYRGVKPGTFKIKIKICNYTFTGIIFLKNTHTHGDLKLCRKVLWLKAVMLRGEYL